MLPPPDCRSGRADSPANVAQAEPGFLSQPLAAAVRHREPEQRQLDRLIASCHTGIVAPFPPAVKIYPCRAAKLNSQPRATIVSALC